LNRTPDTAGEKTLGEELGYSKFQIYIGFMAPETYVIRPSFSIGVLTPIHSIGLSGKLSDEVNFGIQSWLNFGFIF
jgi:hypothetical protein